MAIPASTRTSSIGRHTRVIGEIKGRGGLVVEGRVKGDIKVTGPVLVREGATVEGSVNAESAAIDGSVEGDVTATGAISIGASASVIGNLRGAGISIEPGAQVSVRLEAKFDLAPTPATHGVGHPPGSRASA